MVHVLCACAEIDAVGVGVALFHSYRSSDQAAVPHLATAHAVTYEIICASSAKTQHMKTLSLLLALLSFNAMAQIPNGNFEAWTEINEILEPDEWITLNSFTSMFGELSAEQGSPAPAGSYFLSLTTREFFDGNLPGLAMTSFPYTQRPASCEGHVRYNTVPDDPAVAMAYLTRWNAMAGEQEFIGVAQMEWAGDMMNWQIFSMPFEYYSIADPDSAHVILISSTGDEPEVQNHAAFDDLSFSLSVGVSEVKMAELELFPVPALNTINLSAGSTMRELWILNAEGREVANRSVNALITTVDVAALTSGVYFARVLMSDGTISVHRFVKE
jgi:hypothetical protein